MDYRQPTLNVKREALELVGAFLVESGYVHALSRFVERAPFPEFSGIQGGVAQASPFHKLALSLFLQGHPVATRFVRTTLPERIINACLETGLLCTNHLSEFCTGGRGISAVSGVFVFGNLPPEYPTSVRPSGVVERPPEPWDASLPDVPAEVMLAFPGEPVSTYRGKRCLVIESYPAWESRALAAIAGGAESVYAAVADPERRSCLAFSALLSGLGDVVEVAERLPEPGPDSVFDYVAESRVPLRGIESAASLGRKVERLCSYAAPAFSGRIDCCAEGTVRAIEANERAYELARTRSIAVQSIVFDKYLYRRADGQGTNEARRMTHLFTQSLLFKRDATTLGGVVTVPLYDSKQSDPLVSLVSRYRSAC